MSKTKPTVDPSKKIRQVRYEYFARMCKTAAGIKAPTAPDLDALLGEYSAFAMNLAKDLADANTYYQRETYKEDNFAKGKELHAKLVDEFKKIDDYEKKLSDALTRFKTDNPIDRSGWTESRNLADAVVVATRELYIDLDAATVDVAKSKADLAKLDAAIDTLKKYGTDHKEAQDAYAQIVSPAGDRAAKHGHEVLDAEGFKAPAPHQVVALATFFEQVLDGNYRALIKQLRTDSGAPAGFGDKMQHPRMPGGHPIVPQRIQPTPQQ